MEKQNVLIVEDDVNLLDGIREILEIDDYRVTIAQNGKQGLEVLRGADTPPDLIISDIMMPHMDGFEFFENVRKEERWLSIPFIFLTAKDNKKDVQHGKRLGVDDYLVKPFDADDLLVAIEQRLRRQNELNYVREDALSTLKRDILTIIHHEFRTPLTFVVAYADMLKEHQDGGPPGDAEMLTFLRGINEGARRIRRLIENFIVLIELETGEAQQSHAWRKQPIEDLATLVMTAWNGVRNEYPKRDPIFALEIDPNIPVFVADLEYLRTACTQMLDNALKFARQDEPLMVKVGAQVEQDEIHIWVQDNGRGIPKHEAQNIWGKFHQIDRATHEDQGTGTGLAIVKGVAELHEGRAFAEAAPGNGSIFVLAFPFVPPDPSSSGA